MASLLSRVFRSPLTRVLSQPRRSLNIHEYQSQALMKKFGVRSPDGYPATNIDEVKAAVEKIGGGPVVVKSQILAGGRGKGSIVESGFQGGVHVAKNVDEAVSISKELLGKHLTTKQTGPEGLPINTLLIADCLDVAKEYYFAITVDRAVGGPIIIASKEGGMNIEEVAESNPDAIIKVPMHPDGRPEPEKCEQIARDLGFSDEQVPAVSELFNNLYTLFQQCDSTMVEVNPLAELSNGDVLAFDAKLNFDDSAEPRQGEIFSLRDVTQEDPRDVEASKNDLNYIGLDGNVACLVNGAGLAMATMDCISLHNGSPNNFLDMGGSATKEQVTAAFKLLVSDPRVTAVWVNIFAGIARADIIAEGIVDAAKNLELNIPIVVRLRGTNSERAAQIIADSGLKIIAENDFDESAKLAVKLANQQ